MLPADWTPHRRDDGEIVGWIRPDGDEWTAVDLLGRERAVAVDWLVAEEALEDAGIAWLADPWVWTDESGTLRQVRLVEVTPEHVVLKTDDFGAIEAPVLRFELPWPAPAGLRPKRADDPVVHPWS